MTPTLSAAAEADILRQIERYAEQGLPPIAHRFQTAVLASMDALSRMPTSGPPVPTANPRLAGLRRWPVKGFAEFWVYYLGSPDAAIVVRILHSKRDVGTILDDRP